MAKLTRRGSGTRDEVPAASASTAIAADGFDEAAEGIAPRGTADGALDLEDRSIYASAPADDSDNSAFLVRWFGWSMIWLLPAFFASTILTLTFGWPGPSWSGLGLAQILFYVAAIVIAAGFAGRRRLLPLRADAERIAGFNLYLVRACFLAVVFVGLGDAVISGLRVEGFLGDVVGVGLERDLGRSQFRGPWVHVPLVALAFLAAIPMRSLGFHWLALLIVLAELAIVITRFVFSYEQAFMGDLVRFWYAALFLFASAYTLIAEGHVRVDVFYAGFTNRTKGTVNAVGSILLGITLCWTIIVIGMGGRSSIVYGAIANWEVSQSGFGLYVKYWMAAFLAVFAVTMLIQFVAYLFDAVADRRGRPGSRITGAAPAH